MNNINIKLLNEKCMPTKGTKDSAGFDLYANIDQSVTISPMKRVLVPTGFCMELPKMHEAQIRSRSGLAYKNGISVLNSPGTIDSDYRQEVKVILINLGEQDFVIEPYFRIAQMIINRLDDIMLRNAEIMDTARGGFGSTGIK
ncbi:dUTP diphosphatase [Candidatus Cytomitobacter indipagum]|uniref:dUTP diphosphatase n=1 Tax=Candidatus Cytomitobacter indipagum TaxID=2601575 RepID=A0A5C0UE31_9PROT|nr:dUTP diphosphatase [Candidatus Cytomitobacter indipagum]QEK37941.1 dUTP diphosphatase [Candidatus Cytomitobacter indipagum]